ncbi:4'-phosphopantetheinyl transferase superfamily protein [Micromonospora sp. WMMD1102]|uniref:4'-phosphopantetheinyl transferase family protein n=1 Tax=Micromonospora sp. WMMD1102 TaxID=3016105 RepID=UPI002414E99B|nr:4'-phosphopantetheinyl transferase superfamily protein [Micromonospora sp. WMMD1102]MDG4786903.1 4'-phosphopantetheinyl transferase superfamily protein [Micromonospora sp. WMMD1102]
MTGSRRPPDHLPEADVPTRAGAGIPVLPVPGECQVWRLPIGPMHWAGLDVLDEEERQRHVRFRKVADRDRYQAAHVGVRMLLGHYLGVPGKQLSFSRHCRHCGAGHGKPVVEEPATKLDFSLTHSGEWVAVAVAADPVGLDVQELTDGTDVGALSSSVLSPTELRWWNGQPAESARRAFFGYWARKEALLKATGHGLAVPMNRITLSPPDEPARLVDWAAERPLDSPVQLHDLDAGPDYTAAVAVLSSLPVRVSRAEFSASLVAGRAMTDPA